ncbi:hypothetical protein Tco_0884500 [Tanacetum coccineum]
MSLLRLTSPFESLQVVTRNINSQEKRSFKLVDEDEVQPDPEPHMDDYEYNLLQGTQMSLEVSQAYGQAHFNRVAILALKDEPLNLMEYRWFKTLNKVMWLSLGLNPGAHARDSEHGPTIEDTLITQADLYPPVNPVAGEPSSVQSTSGDVSQKSNPKNFKMAVIEDCWFQSMQDGIHEFDRLSKGLVPANLCYGYRSQWNLQSEA